MERRSADARADEEAAQSAIAVIEGSFWHGPTTNGASATRRKRANAARVADAQARPWRLNDAESAGAAQARVRVAMSTRATQRKISEG